MRENNYSLYIHITPSGKKYVGITYRKPKYRWDNGNGYRQNKHFYNAIKKYGWDNIIHIILYENLYKEEAEELEKEYIKLYKSNIREYGYNKSSGGESHAKGFRHTEEAKRKIAKASSIINKGKKMSEASREKMSKARMGKPMPIKTIINKSKPVVCVETGEIYYGEKYAGYKTGINDKNINNCLKGRRKTAGGYHWRYYYEGN